MLKAQTLGTEKAAMGMLKTQTLGTQKAAPEGEEESEGSEKDQADDKTTGTTNGFGFRRGGRGQKPTLRIWKGPSKRREAAKTTNNEGQQAARCGERNRTNVICTAPQHHSDPAITPER